MYESFVTFEAILGGETSFDSGTYSQTNGDNVARGSNRFGWLHTFRSCIRMLITLIKLPEARVS